MASPKKVHDLSRVSPQNEAPASGPYMLPEALEMPRFYFDLKFYPDGQGIIQYPLTQESANFRGLDERAIIEFIKTKLTPPPVEKSKKAVVSKKTATPPPVGDQLRINLAFSRIRGSELARKRSIEVDVNWEKAEAVPSVYCYIKSLKTAQVTVLGACVVNTSPASGKSGTARIMVPALAPGLYRITATDREIAQERHADAGEGWVFQVI